jgi:peptide/nickel transport system ATP-binding protein
MSNPLLSLDNVSKYFGYGVIGLLRFPAVDGVNLSIGSEKPEVVTIVGESGSGKTTVAKIMLRILKPTHGVVKYLGKDLWKLNRGDIRRFIKDVQPIFQDPMDTFNPFETVDSYLISVARSLLKLDKDESIERISRTLEFVGLTFDKVKGKRPNEFSGGELQRISIARALLAQPRLLIADEPVSMIDASLRINILNYLRRAKDELNISIVYITHDIATANYVGDKIYVMYRGSVVEQGDIDKVIENPLHPYTKVLLESLPDYRKGREWFKTRLAQSTQTVIEIREMLLKGCKYLSYCPFKTEKCYERPFMIEVEKNHYISCWIYHNNK